MLQNWKPPTPSSLKVWKGSKEWDCISMSNVTFSWPSSVQNSWRVVWNNQYRTPQLVSAHSQSLKGMKEWFQFDALIAVLKQGNSSRFGLPKRLQWRDIIMQALLSLVGKGTPFGPLAFDVVRCCLSKMFWPQHQAAKQAPESVAQPIKATLETLCA